MDRRTLAGVGAALVTQLLYGGSFVFTKDLTNTIDPFTLLGWRFTVAMAALLGLLAFRAIRIGVTRAALRPLLVLAAFQPVIYYVTETYGVMRTSASESGLIMAAIPVVMLLTSALVLGSRPSRRQVAGISVTVAGVVVTVVASGLRLGFDPVGYVLLLVAVSAYAMYAAFAERFAHASDVDKTFVMIASGAVCFGTVALAQHAAAGSLGALVTLPIDRPDFALGIAYLALGPTIGAFFLQNLAISRLGSTRFSTFVGVSTLAALAAGALVLGERLSPLQLAGGGAILAGVYIANRRKTSDADVGPARVSA